LVWGRARAGRVRWQEVPAVSGRDPVGLVDLVAAEQVAVCKRLAPGLELATMAARLLCPEWSLVLRAEPQVVAVSRPKKSF